MVYQICNKIDIRINNIPHLLVKKFSYFNRWKHIKEDAHFAKVIANSTESVFREVLLDNVNQELRNIEYSTVTDLVKNTSVTYYQH